jgi:hypothetical protein
MNTARQHDFELIDLYADDAGEEQSGVRLRRRRAPQLIFMDSIGHEPSSVYVSYIGASRRYYLGTRFVSGIIPASDWSTPMQRDGAPLEVLQEIAGWLSEHAL